MIPLDEIDFPFLTGFFQDSLTFLSHVHVFCVCVHIASAKTFTNFVPFGIRKKKKKSVQKLPKGTKGLNVLMEMEVIIESGKPWDTLIL